MPSGAWREGPFLSLSWPFQRLVLLSLARGPVLHLQSQQLSTCSLPSPAALANILSFPYRAGLHQALSLVRQNTKTQPQAAASVPQ